LFPFFRNHAIANSKAQEPWQFGPAILGPIRDLLHTRYRLLPYLYQCFFSHHLTGDPILRPLLYEFDDRELENLDDQYMVGASLMAAPVVQSEQSGDSVVCDGIKRHLRHVTFPAGWWYDLNLGGWIEGGRTLRYAAAMDEVPLFAREGAIIPWYNGPLKNGDTPLGGFELHLFMRETSSPAATTLYLDDQKTRKYLEGGYNTAAVTVAIAGSEATLEITETGPLEPGALKPGRAVFYGAPFLKRVVTGRGRGGKGRKLKPAERRWVGRNLAVSVAA
jgi:alpha-glucosidase